MSIMKSATPPDVKASYEGRWIINQDGLVDIVHDRHGIEGVSDVEKGKLGLWLNPHLRTARRKLAEALRDGTISTRDKGWRFLYEDAEGCIIANPNGSAGYAYIVAYRFDQMAPGATTKGYEFNVIPALAG